MKNSNNFIQQAANDYSMNYEDVKIISEQSETYEEFYSTLEDFILNDTAI